MWDSSNGRLLSSFFGTTDGQWFAITPEGFFAGSVTSADRMLSLVRGLGAMPIDQVHQSLFNPDLVREAIAGDSNREVQEAAKVPSTWKRFSTAVQLLPLRSYPQPTVARWRATS
jgi:hypothetical protein